MQVWTHLYYTQIVNLNEIKCQWMAVCHKTMISKLFAFTYCLECALLWCIQHVCIIFCCCQTVCTVINEPLLIVYWPNLFSQSVRSLNPVTVWSSRSNLLCLVLEIGLSLVNIPSLFCIHFTHHRCVKVTGERLLRLQGAIQSGHFIKHMVNILSETPKSKQRSQRCSGCAPSPATQRFNSVNMLL